MERGGLGSILARFGLGSDFGTFLGFLGPILARFWLWGFVGLWANKKGLANWSRVWVLGLVFLLAFEPKWEFGFWFWVWARSISFKYFAKDHANYSSSVVEFFSTMGYRLSSLWMYEQNPFCL